MIGRMIRAKGADDVARFRIMSRKIRFQMITDILTNVTGSAPSRAPAVALFFEAIYLK
jgi:hypothetical protein